MDTLTPESAHSEMAEIERHVAEFNAVKERIPTLLQRHAFLSGYLAGLESGVKEEVEE